MKPRAAITLIFFANGALFASWISRIPSLSDRIHADPGLLGLVLLAPAVAAAITMPGAGRLLARGSSARLTRAALAAQMIALTFPALAHTSLSLGAVLLVLGAANATLDVSMNAQGVAVERALGRPILSSLHAAYSFGGFAGAGGGALAAAVHLAPLPHLIVAAVVFGVPGLAATAFLHAADNDPDAGAAALRWRALPTRLILLGVACFFGLLAEGAAADWSAKLVKAEPVGSAALGALAYAAFSIGMAGGRLLADRLWARWGPVTLIRGGATVAAAGFVVALVIDRAPVQIAGFLVLGLGLSGVVPTLFRSAADQRGVAAGPALAAVSSLGYVGFLVGPPVIGGVAQITSLRLAVGVLALAALGVAVLARAASVQAPVNSEDEVLV